MNPGGHWCFLPEQFIDYGLGYLRVDLFRFTAMIHLGFQLDRSVLCAWFATVAFLAPGSFPMTCLASVSGGRDLVFGDAQSILPSFQSLVPPHITQDTVRGSGTGDALAPALFQFGAPSIGSRASIAQSSAPGFQCRDDALPGTSVRSGFRQSETPSTDKSAVCLD